MTVDGGWSDWTAWDQCPITCGGGTHDRSRTCTNPAPQYGGADCTGSDAERENCNIHNCPSKFNLYYLVTVQSVAITTKVVSLNPVHIEVYSIQHYVIKFVSDLRQVSGFLRVLGFPPPVKLAAMI